MGEPITGAWAQKYQLLIPYVDARKWGTGINPVHSQYGGPGRSNHPKLDVNQLDGHTPVTFATPQEFIQENDWGYQHEDIAGLDVFADPNMAVHGGGVFFDQVWPEWSGRDADYMGTIGDPPAGGAPGPVGPQTGKNRSFVPRWASRPWGSTGAEKNRLRSIRAGESEADTPGTRGISSETPTESVNMGWVNKGSSGEIAPGEIPDDNVMPSSPAQYERQTSMQQRKQTLNNNRAVARGQDDPRSSIPSRLVPMKIRYFSGQQPFAPGQPDTYRAYDMFPYQLDDMPRGFSYRTAGTGPQRYLETNEQADRTALQRQPPPDPSMGIPETQLTDPEYGYSTEDQGYY